MIILAHDGTLYGDWVAQYAINLAANGQQPKLLCLHVLDGSVTEEIIAHKFVTLEKLCTLQKIDFSYHILPSTGNTYRTLRHAIPHDSNALLVCGTRVKMRKRSLLTGSMAEKLLKTHLCPVLAVRVVLPGRLGNPHSLLLPLAGHGQGSNRFMPFLSRLAPQLHHLHLFRVMTLDFIRHAHLSRRREEALRLSGMHYLDLITRDILEKLPEFPHYALNCQVSIATSWPDEIVIQATRLKVHLIMLGISERNLAHQLVFGKGLEQVLLNAPCDVGIYRAP